MRQFSYFVVAALVVSLSGCNAALRQPQFELEETENQSTEVVYEVDITI